MDEILKAQQVQFFGFGGALLTELHNDVLRLFAAVATGDRAAVGEMLELVKEDVAVMAEGFASTA